MTPVRPSCAPSVHLHPAVLVLAALSLAWFPASSAAQKLPIRSEGPRQLLVLLAETPDGPSPEAVVARAALGASLPEPLDLGEPTGARYLISERPAGGTPAAEPDSPRALLLRYLVVDYPKDADLVPIREALGADARVLDVSSNELIQLSAVTPSDDLFSLQWGLPALDLPDAWDRTFGHAYVALVDTGIDTTHQDLRAFDGNGDYVGGNFRVRLARDFGYDDDDVDEGQPQVEGGQLRQVERAGHGTHVAGIAAATTDNAEGVAGACPHCSLIISKASTLIQDFMGQWANTNTLTANVVDALYGSVDRGAQVSSMSLGFRAGTCSPNCVTNPTHPFCLAVAYADERDVVLTASSGNDGDDAVDYPASDPRVLAAGGLEPTGGFWNDCTTPPSTNCFVHRECGSNYGPSQFVTPAKEVVSTFFRAVDYYPAFDCGDALLPGFPGYGYCTGTSMSAPYLAGSVGLLRSLNPLLLRPNLEAVLLANLDNPPGWDPQHGHGKPDVAAAADDVLGVAAGAVLPNRLTPLFTAYSPLAESHFYSTAPQMMTAALFDAEAPFASAEGSPTPGYGEFPGAPCQISPCGPLVPAASVYLFTSPAAPFPGSPPLVPLYRMGFDEPFGGNPFNRSFFYTTEVAGLEVGKALGYELDGREGYIFQRCTPEPSCIPAGAVRLHRLYHSGRDDYAIVPESEVAAFQAQGYVYPSGLNQWIGYVYPNVDSDGDSLIDGFETVVASDPANADTDCDGGTDGEEVLEFPYGDPLDALCGSISADPEEVILEIGQLGDTTVTWSTTAAPGAQVWVKPNSGNEVLMAQAPSGSAVAPWIAPNRAYEFLLFASPAKDVLLDYATVFGLVAGGGQVTAYPRPIVAPAGTLNETTVKWATHGLPTAQVWVSVDGNPEVLMAQSADGSGVAGWIVPGRTYTFRLYAGTQHSVLLDSVVVEALVE